VIIHTVQSLEFLRALCQNPDSFKDVVKKHLSKRVLNQFKNIQFNQIVKEKLNLEGVIELLRGMTEYGITQV